MFNNLLFVCVGNICRSPMAEGYFREKLKHNPKIKIASAGLNAAVGSPAVPEAQELMSSIGIDISAHRARPLTSEIVSETDLVLVMENVQKKEIEFIFPHLCGRIHLVGRLGNIEIPDPYKRAPKFFTECLRLIEKGWEDWEGRLL